MTAEPTHSPLELVEQCVLARAKHGAIDVSSIDGTNRMKVLIDEAIEQWNLDHRRGLRPFELTDSELIAERALRNLTGYGPLGPLLADDDVWEIMVNAPDQIFVKRHRGRSGYHHEAFHDDEHVVRTITKILDDASASHRSLDPSEGLQDAQLDNGARVHIVHGDIARGGHLLVNIRKFVGVRFHHLNQLVEAGTIDEQAGTFLRACVRARRTIVFSGAPGSGKTTMLSCCAAELDPALRVVVAEEVFEADVPLANVASMQTRAARVDRPAIDLRRLVAGFLRMAPDVAIVGEVRDREALPLLLTLSSGVQGFTTIHAGSARQALTRLRFICQLSDAASELPITALNTLVAESVDVVVHCIRTSDGPRVASIIAVEDLAGGSDTVQFTTTDVFARSGDDRLRWTGQVPVRMSRALADAGFDVRSLLGACSVTNGSRS
jgi:pilus assembly protein CpaF